MARWAAIPSPHQSRGFDGQLFSPGAARRGCAACLNGGWLSGGGESASNVPPRLEVVPNGAALALLGIDARRSRGSMSSDLDQMAWLLISLSAQSSSLSVATCRPAAIRACSGRFYLHLKQMDSCGDGSRGSPPSSRFGGMHHILGVKPLSSHYRSAYVRVLMRAPKVVLCSRCVTGDWLIVFKPRGETSKYRVTALTVVAASAAHSNRLAAASERPDRPRDAASGLAHISRGIGARLVQRAAGHGRVSEG